MWRIQSNKVMGVDLGENNIAATSTGKLVGGGKLRYDRDRFLALRRRLQRNGSQSAKQLLKRLSGKEARHVTQVNHQVANAIIAEAIKNNVGVIALEKLTNIRKRIASRNKHRLICSCGNRAHSDLNASQNLAWLGETAVSSRGEVNRPNVAA